MTVEPLSGWRSVRVTQRHTSVDFAEGLRYTDNLNLHRPTCLYEAFSPAEVRRIASKIEWHYTP